MTPWGGNIYARAFNIFSADLEEYGYTALCPGCAAIRDGIGYRLHSRTCRSRLRSELMKTPAGRQRIERAEARPVRRPRDTAQAIGNSVPNTPPGPALSTPDGGDGVIGDSDDGADELDEGRERAQTFRTYESTCRGGVLPTSYHSARV